MACRIVPQVALVLILFGGIGNSFCQDSNSAKKESAPAIKSELKGKSVFESRCALCHGLDGRGGEHAPDIARQAAVTSLSDQALLNMIHNGIPQGGMPPFGDIGKEDGQALVAYLRFLQGRSGVGSMSGDPARGHDLFFGKAGCSACHAIRGQGQPTAGDLTGYGQGHQAGDIRDAILNHGGRHEEIATAVAHDGRKFSGTIRNEDNISIQLQDDDDKDGRFYLLMKSSLVSIQRRTAIATHVDYEKQLSRTEFNELVSYLANEVNSPDQSSPPGKDSTPDDKN
ncbi:MAG: c-type cytochrome [Candidatus Sulfotelmatobacter sp.]